MLLPELESLLPVEPCPLPPVTDSIRYAAPEESAKAPGAIGWRGELLSGRSFAHVNRESILALRARGVDVTVFPTDVAPGQDVSRWPGATALLEKPDPQKTFSAWVEYLAEDVPPPPPSGRPVYLVVWESPLLPERFAEAILSRGAEVWAASRPVAEACLRAGVPGERVYILPHGVDREVFHPRTRPMDLGLAGRFVFLFAGVSHYRKGVDIAVNAFLEEFSPQEPVSLVIKDAPSSFGWGENLREPLQALAAKDPRLVYLINQLSSPGMAALYAAVDVIVAPSRGEGFHLPVLEAMATGRPVITTPTGVAPDLCTGENAIVIGADPVFSPSWEEGVSPLSAPSWLRPRREELRRAMRRLYQDHALRASLGREARRATRPYTWENVAALMAGRLAR